MILGAGEEEREPWRACASEVVVWEPASAGCEPGAWSAGEKLGSPCLWLCRAKGKEGSWTESTRMKKTKS